MFYVLRTCSSKVEMETGLCANVSLFFPCILITLCGCSIPWDTRSLHTEQQTEQVSTGIPFFLAGVYKSSNCTPNTSCSLCASCTCVCVHVGLFKTSWAESRWKSFTGCVIGQAWNSRLTPKLLARRQVGITMFFSLARIRRGFSLHFIVPYVDDSPAGHAQPLLMYSNCSQGCILRPLTQPSHPRTWDLLTLVAFSGATLILPITPSCTSTWFCTPT